MEEFMRNFMIQQAAENKQYNERFLQQNVRLDQQNEHLKQQSERLEEQGEAIKTAVDQLKTVDTKIETKEEKIAGAELQTNEKIKPIEEIFQGPVTTFGDCQDQNLIADGVLSDTTVCYQLVDPSLEIAVSAILHDQGDQRSPVNITAGDFSPESFLEEECIENEPCKPSCDSLQEWTDIQEIELRRAPAGPPVVVKADEPLVLILNTVSKATWWGFSSFISAFESFAEVVCQELENAVDDGRDKIAEPDFSHESQKHTHVVIVVEGPLTQAPSQAEAPILEEAESHAIVLVNDELPRGESKATPDASLPVPTVHCVEEDAPIAHHESPEVFGRKPKFKDVITVLEHNPSPGDNRDFGDPLHVSGPEQDLKGLILPAHGAACFLQRL